ncbi:sugar transferase [Mucilaginibacter sp. dw_454]|uniref:sugar transferase n=1 Tax=Mucilaginibacter sp. dw_454 TaxID=2720079 RepID=UPI001BD2CC93|nr:sugar transferase [Mucilaginibacter sp. dw_454]
MVYRDFFKPVIDLFISVIAFVILLPIFVLVLLLLCIANQGSPFFFQPRPGENARIFKVIKFKTMNDRCDASGNLLPDEIRLTKIGKFARKTSLDELPQLLNVIKGDMSLIGPRPLLVEYLSLYNQTEKRRHEVKPGITGWAQVNGRNAISWEQKFKFDVWYVDHISFSLDIKILWLTLIKVFKSEGVNQEGFATAKKFVKH